MPKTNCKETNLYENLYEDMEQVTASIMHRDRTVTDKVRSDSTLAREAKVHIM